MSEPITTPCLIEGLSEAVYHRDPVEGGSLSYTGMKELLKTPAHYRWYMDQPRVEKAAFDEGHIIHSLVLGTDLPVAVIPPELLAKNGATSTKAAKEFIANARLNGLIPVKAGDMDGPQQIAEAVLAYPPAQKLFEADGLTEASMFAPDPASGVWIRGRADKVAMIDGETILVDLKTCQSADPADFNRQAIAKFGYYLQAHVYTWLYQQIVSGEEAPDFRIVAVSKSEPHLVSVHSLDWEYDDLAKRDMRTAIQRYQACTETGEWPGYPEEITEQSPPNWMVGDLELELKL